MLGYGFESHTILFFRLIDISYYDKGGTVYEEIVTKSKGFKGMEFE